MVDQVDHLLGADDGGDEAAGREIILDADEPLGEPGWHARPAMTRVGYSSAIGRLPALQAFETRVD